MENLTRHRDILRSQQLSHQCLSPTKLQATPRIFRQWPSLPAHMVNSTWQMDYDLDLGSTPPTIQDTSWHFVEGFVGVFPESRMSSRVKDPVNSIESLSWFIIRDPYSSWIPEITGVVFFNPLQQITGGSLGDLQGGRALSPVTSWSGAITTHFGGSGDLSSLDSWHGWNRLDGCRWDEMLMLVFFICDYINIYIYTHIIYIYIYTYHIL